MAPVEYGVRTLLLSLPACHSAGKYTVYQIFDSFIISRITTPDTWEEPAMFVSRLTDLFLLLSHINMVHLVLFWTLILILMVVAMKGIAKAIFCILLAIDASVLALGIALFHPSALFMAVILVLIAICAVIELFHRNRELY